jgi:hypothetical protein
MKLTQEEIKSALNQWTFDGGSVLWRKLCDELLPPKGTKITKEITKKINISLSKNEIAELKSII